ncbi:MAG: FkbM family methyltransferase [Candidatus Lokiarchaeota archaeon]|nr:FkbM family methyltransferase [Candidatus Lokiarchaeota archaeon]
MIFKVRTQIRRILGNSTVYPHLRNFFLKYKSFFPWEIKEYFQMVSFYSQFLQKGDLVFDIGANLGEYTMNFLRMKTHVVSVEPQLQCLKDLYSRFGKNKRVMIVRKALGEKECISTISICEDAKAIATLSEKWKKEGRFSKDHEWTIKQKVEITTLDHLIKLYGLPKFCKIDVEGFEVEVLKGLSQKIPIISFEFTKEFIDDALTCMKLLESFGKVKFNYVKDERYSFNQQTWSSREKLCEILNSDPDDLLCGDIYARFG